METRRVLSASYNVDVKGFRYLGAAMIGLGVSLPLLPHNPGLPCPLKTLTGVPCPACGMTTSVKATLAGHLGSAVAANPFGILAIVVAVALLVRPSVRHVRVPLSLLIGLALVSWTWELHRFGFV